MDFTHEGLDAAEFDGFIRIADSGGNVVPEQPGVYVVLREKDTNPEYLTEGSWRDGPDARPPYAVGKLARKWVRGAVVVYFGATEAEGRTLRERVGELRDFGAGMSLDHHGGRAMWQLADRTDLVVAWRIAAWNEAAPQRNRLLREFRTANRKLPFASWQVRRAVPQV